MNASQQMSQLEALIAHARKNEDIARRMFELDVAILKISSVQDFLELLHAHLRECFGIDEVWYALIDKPATQTIRATLERSEKLSAQWRSVAAVDFHAAFKGTREPVLDHRDLLRFKPLTSASTAASFAFYRGITDFAEWQACREP